MVQRKTVVVGMSGGVDSSLTAALLLQQGYHVIGVTMRLWEDDSLEKVEDSPTGCCALSAVQDAKNVCDILGVPHYVLNFKESFRERVVNYFIEEYLRGRTPNPCIACNRFMKFDLLMSRALALGADYVATGHYARIFYDSQLQRWLLAKGADASKDQSYVLYHLTQETLSRFLLPLGGFTKAETRRMAQQLKLPVFAKPDSQEICFIPDDDYKGFLSRMAPERMRPGNFVDVTGKILGQHSGIALYTIGQRKGLGIALGSPRYVIKIDAENNEVVLGTHEQAFSRGCMVNDLNYIALDHLTERLPVQSKIRYNAGATDSHIEAISDGLVKVVFDKPQRAVTPGQSIVFYNNHIVIGGGTIDRVFGK